MTAERLTRELAEMVGRGPVRRVVVTEMAEVWSRRNQRRRLVRSTEAVNARRDTPEGTLRWHLLHRALDSDREHLTSLRRILAAVKEH